MCNSKIKSGHGIGLAEVAQIDGRPVLQPACNRVASLEAGRQLKKSFQKSLSLPISITIATRIPSTNSSDVEANDNSPVASTKASSSPRKPSSPVSPTSRPLKPVLKRANSLNLSTDKPLTPKSSATKATPILVRKKSKKSGGGVPAAPVSLESSLDSKSSLSSFSFWSHRAPGSLAAAQREQASLMQAQRKMRIAHYGRTPAKLEGKVVPIDASNANAASQEEKRCSFITANSDPLYVAYHDEEWGVPVHDDKMLFELLVLTGAQVGLDWTTILKKRTEFREAFAGFDAEVVAGFTERRVASMSADYGMDLSRVRGAVNNANRILELRKGFGSLDKYLWGFMNHKPIATNYKSCRKIPVKTSKSESISKDLVRRGFRFVGPTVVHSFMQAAGLTNDHILSCPRHSHCSALSSSSPSTTTTTH